MRDRKWARVSAAGLLTLALGTAACSETWEGVKEDTRENVQTTTQGVQNAKENIEKRVE